MKKRLNFIGILSLFLFNSVYAITCPDKEKAPLCPNSGSTLLDETYPTQAYVISNMPKAPGIQSNKVTYEFIGKIAKSYNYENMPQVLVPVESKEEFTQVISKVKEDLEKNKLPEQIIQKILSQISHIESRKFTWQQDYFESFVDLKTGAPVLREFESYLKDRPAFVSGAVDKMQEAGSTCQIAKGEVLKTHHELYTPPEADGTPQSFGSGEMGGNVEGAPAGFCLAGDNQSKKLTMQFCGKEENIIKLQTSWLTVGHVDEIFKIIPSQFNDGRPSECSFSLMAASPKKAMELMENSRNATNSFFSFPAKLNEAELKEVRRSRANKAISYGSQIICDFIENAIEDGSYTPKQSQNLQNTNRSVFMNFFIQNAFAGVSREDIKHNFNCEEHIDRIPNNKIKDSLKANIDLANLNQAIQESIDKDKQLIRSKILSRLPQCEKYFDFLDVPNLFYGSPPIVKDGKFELPKPSDVDSFLPNPTNSVLMNRTVLLPETGNTTFDNYVEEELKKRKIKTEPIDSWDYAHVGHGNIHCSSHSIPYCKPRI